MKRIALGFAAALLVAMSPPARAQTGGAYDLHWNQVGAGGDTFAEGGAYRIGGTVAQYATGPASGGVYSIAGGLWVPELVPNVGVGDREDALPVAFAARLGGANPFQASTSIRFDLPEPRRVVISLYGVDGRLVRTLTDAAFGAGRHAAYWDGMDVTGRAAAPGIYFARVTAGDTRVTLRLVRIH